MAQLMTVLLLNKMRWHMPSPRATVNTDPYEVIYLTRDIVGTLQSNMVTLLDSDECQPRSA